jgi:hypothetical protein
MMYDQFEGVSSQMRIEKMPESTQEIKNSCVFFGKIRER